MHRLVEDRTLWLCGVKVPHTHGLLGHSDADVAIHALCDALLGAASLRDIGYHFPDNKPEYKGIDSKILLKNIINLLKEKGWSVGNVDITIIAEAPKLKPYIEEMIVVLSEIMEISSDCVSVKATTTEGLGFAGKKEGIASMAVALITKSKDY